MTIYWSMFYTAVIRGMWWWWLPPIVVLVLLFIGLFLIAAGLDQVANPPAPEGSRMTNSSASGEARPDVLRVVGLRTQYMTPQGAVKAVDGVSSTSGRRSVSAWPASPAPASPAWRSR